MKKLFQAIRHSDLETVKELLTKKPELVHCTAKQPPKKDHGQSPLQVALKTGEFNIAEYLLDMNADVNFMEADEGLGQWRAPVVQDAVNMAVMCSRWNEYSEKLYGGIKVFHDKSEADRAFGVLKGMVERGADLNREDSFGNTCIWRFCLQARQVLPTYIHSTHETMNDRILTPELSHDLQRIFDLLYENGMDIDYVRPKINKTVREQYVNEPVLIFPDNAVKK